MKDFFRFVIFIFVLSAFPIQQTAAGPVEPRDDEMVVFIGSEFIEQLTKHNFVEAHLTQSRADSKVRFRNLGWSGDTPTAIARGYFNGQAEGMRRLMEELDRLKPTRIVVCYGANSEPETFEKDFKILFENLKNRSSNIVVMSHPAAEKLGDEFADPTAANQIRQKNAATLRQIVENQNEPKVLFADLFSISQKLIADNRQKGASKNFTTDTIRYTEFGYREIGKVILDTTSNHLNFGEDRKSNLDEKKFDALRGLIKEKNDLYFHRYRPQNETYLRGFRKHEQGQNAKEISEFDPLIAKAEERILAFLNGKQLDSIEEPEPIKLSFTAATVEEEKESFRLAEGFEINLFASEPMVANPIHMNFDSEGRLWVATSPIYPQIKPGAKPKDEIVILEDTNNDGRADKRTVFADDLLIPTAVLPDNQGGAYVANSTELLHLEDTDGDGKADKRRVVLSGFGTEDTHHILHTFRWGPDASLYFNQSIYIHTHMETPHGVRRLMGAGVWRLEPKAVSASVLMRGSVNPWGHIFDDWGQSFTTDGAGGFGIHYAFPGVAYQTAVGYSKTIRGLNPGQPKLCGLEIVTGRHFPESWQNTLITNDYRGNRINRFQLTPEDSGYVSKQLPDLMSSSHRAFRPVDVKMAPDGGLMIADWYNPIINHGEVDFRDSRRDYKHGRIWRLTSKGQPKIEKPDYKNASIEQLLEMMALPERWSRFNARVEIKNRIGHSKEKFEQDLSKPLERLLNSNDPTSFLAGLWTLAAVKQLNDASLESGMEFADYRVRAATLRVISDSGLTGPKIQKMIASSLSDDHAQVRLEAINGWHQVVLNSKSTDDSFDSIETILKVLDQPVDQNIEFLLGQVLKRSNLDWADQLNKQASKLDSKKLIYVLKNAGAKQAVEPIVSQIIDGNLLASQKSGAIALMGEHANPQQLKRLYEFSHSDPASRAEILAAITTAANTRKIRPKISADSLLKDFDDPNIVRLTGALKLEELKPRIVEIASDSQKLASGLQPAAISSLISFGDFGTVEKMASDPAQSIAIRRFAINQLLVKKPNRAADLAAKLIKGVKKSERPEAVKVVANFLRRRNGATLLQKSLTRKPLDQKLAMLIIDASAQFGREGQRLATSLRADNPKPKTIARTAADLPRLVESVRKNGDPANGESVYRRADLSCIKCHAIGGAGGVVGPDMISLGASSPVDYIVQSLIEPNAKIKEGYHTTTIVTADGQQVSGKLMSEADGKLVMRDAENRELVFKTEDVEGKKISPISLMPADLTNGLTEKEFVDLAAFLSQLGKEGPYKIATEVFVRKWNAEDGTSLFSKVDGTLPVSELKGNMVSFDFNVTKPGAIGFEVANPDGLRITLDDMKDNLRAKRIVKDLPVGQHRFTFKVINKAARKSLSVKLIDVKDSSGRAVVNQ